jgi:hypothetical protein
MNTLHEAITNCVAGLRADGMQCEAALLTMKACVRHMVRNHSGADMPEILYSDPQFLGQRLGLDLLYDSNSDGDRRHFSLTSGFRSLDSPRGGTLLFDQGRSKTRLYANGGEVARFEMDTRSYEVSAGRRLSLDGDRPVTRLFVGYRRQEARFGGEREGEVVRLSADGVLEVEGPAGVLLRSVPAGAQPPG